MQCYSGILPPTAVTDAVALNFLGPKQLDLVVAKTTLLQVFRIVRDGSQSGAQLLLIGEYELSGIITSLEKIHTQDDQDGVDSLLIAFKDAKISLVRWDHDNHRLSTVSIHYYEGDPVPRQPCDTSVSHVSSILTVDPSSRCVALKFDQRQLAILPFRQPGEDLNELDDDVDMADSKTIVKTETNGTTHETPYKRSFVLSLPSLDESLTDVIDLAFLHDYREPTFGILTSAGQASSALWSEGKDILTYHILTLDLEQGASTILASITHLSADIWKVKPLPAPIGGALLLGPNEIVHVAQSGKTQRIIVNEFADPTSSFTTTDQSSLDLKLEDCVVDVLDAKACDLLFALRDGSLAILHFTMLGPDVKAIKFSPITKDAGGLLLEGLPSCIASVAEDCIFLGSDESDSLLLTCHKSMSSRKRSHAEMAGDVEAEENAEEEDDDDDLYGTTTRRTRASAKSNSHAAKTATTYTFETCDTLHSLGPMSKPCLGKSPSCPDKLEFAAITGRGRGSRFALCTRDLRPSTEKTVRIEDTKAVWSIRAVKAKRKGSTPPSGPDNLLFAYNGNSTSVFQSPWNDVLEDELVELKDTEFEHEGETVDIGTLGAGRWIVHCRQTEVRTYEPDLSLSQIIPMVDDEDSELSIVYTQFYDPYLLIIRSDGTLQILAYDKKSQDVEPLELDEPLAKRKCIGGSLYRGSVTNDETAAFILLDDGSMQIVNLPAATPVYTALNLPHLPPIITADAALRRTGFKETLTEILVADIGIRPFMILRTSADDLVVYEPFGHADKKTWTDHLKFRKVPVPYLPKYDEYLNDDSSARVSPLQPITVGRYSAVVVPGRPPCLIMAEASSRPKILRLQNISTTSLIGINQLAADHNGPSFLTLADDQISSCILPKNLSISTGWSTQKLQVSTTDEVRHVAFHEQGGMYVLSTCKQVDFLFSEDDTRHQDQDDISSRPTVPQYSIHLYSAATHRIINTYTFPPGEAVTCVEITTLEVSEHTHETRPLVAVGIALLRGEDMPARGALVLFDLLSVIPEPDDPETGVKLHVVARETTKGAVTTVAPFIGGLIGVAQGQKLIVRGMKEDGSCLPVAFLDCLCQLATLKTFWKTGLWLAGDVWKGVWLGGFTEEPYKLTFLGKSQTQMEVLCAEFLPFEGQLFILAIDAEMDLHVLQYDPEDPKTVSGARLLHRSTFNLGQWPTSMTLVPSTLAPLEEQLSNGHSDEEPQPLYEILVTTQSGAISLITPLESSAYRRLGNIHGQMASILEHPAALNPKEFRTADGDAAASRGVVDAMLIQRIGELGSARRAEVLARSGSDAWTMRSDLEIISGGGLAWL